jgi:hypothetical protein
MDDEGDTLAHKVCDLQWHQVELAAGRLHVGRSKRGTSSGHPPSRAMSCGH